MSFLGERLRQEREARAITPLQVEIDTRIRANVIVALEEGDLSHLPPEPFLRGLIRSYANYLGVDADQMLELHAADSAPPPPPGRPPSVRRPTAPVPPAPPAPPPASQVLPVPRPARTSTPPPAAPAPNGHPPSQRVSSPPSSLPEQSGLGEIAPASTPRVEETPPPPPEAYEPPEYTVGAGAAPSATPFLAHMSRRGFPLPVIVLVAVALILFCIAVTLVAVTRIAPAVLSASSTRSTPTRPLPTIAPTLAPGTAPTAIPTLAETAQPFATFAGIATAPSGTVVPLIRGGGSLELGVEATEPITLRVAVDNVVAFDGQLDAGASRAWTANTALYVRVENPGGATLTFDGSTKWFGARNYAERSVLERQWTLNDRGTPVSVAPVSPPAASTPTAAVPNAPAAAPSATVTPF